MSALVEVHGDEAVVRTIAGVALRTANLAPAFAALELHWEREEERWFRSNGNGSWPPLSRSTVGRKTRQSKPSEILIDSGRLRDSLIGKTQDSIRAIGPETFVFGTTTPYAFYHQYGTRKMPMRRPLVDTLAMQVHATALVEKYVMESDYVPAISPLGRPMQRYAKRGAGGRFVGRS